MTSKSALPCVLLQYEGATINQFGENIMAMFQPDITLSEAFFKIKH
jgi:hypothetical protein